MLPPTNLTLDPQTRLLLAILSRLNDQCIQHTFATSPYNTSNTGSMGDKLKLMTTTAEANTVPITYDDDDSDSEGPPPSPPLKIHIDATTTIHGNSNRLMLPSPSSTEQTLTKLISVAVKDILPPPMQEKGEVKEAQQQVEVTIDAGTRIEGSGNMVVYRKGLAGAVCGDGKGKGDGAGWEGKKRASSESGARPHGSYDIPPAELGGITSCTVKLDYCRNCMAHNTDAPTTPPTGYLSGTSELITSTVVPAMVTGGRHYFSGRAISAPSSSSSIHS
ncbi:MAG: hypothetical protein Q9208_005793 [Pyrenodesmia sp. 3 TL-2023]